MIYEHSTRCGATNALRYDFTAGGTPSSRRQLAFSFYLCEIARVIHETYRRSCLPILSRRDTFDDFPRLLSTRTERIVSPRKSLSTREQRSARYHPSGTWSNESSRLRVSYRDTGEINYRRDASSECAQIKRGYQTRRSTRSRIRSIAGASSTGQKDDRSIIRQGHFAAGTSKLAPESSADKNHG